MQDASDSLSFEPFPTRAVGKRKRGRPTKRVVMVHDETGHVISGKHAPKREVSLRFSAEENCVARKVLLILDSLHRSILFLVDGSLDEE